MATDFVVAFQGEPGAYSQKACFEMLGSHVRTVGLNTFGAVFSAVESGAAKYAVVPIENSLGGSIHQNFDLLCQHNLHIIAEYDLRVQHCLVALKGVKKDNITIVMSHPQALAQCDGYIRKWGVKQEVTYDTAGTAKMIKEKGMLEAAAICSSVAALEYDMQVLETGIEDDENNFTRFYLLSNHPVVPDVGDGDTKTSIVFSTKQTNEPAVLFKALSVFALRDINLTKVESRPVKPEMLRDQIARWSKKKGNSALAKSGLAGIAAGRTEVEAEDSSVSASPRVSSIKKPQYNYLFYIDCTVGLGQEVLSNALSHLEEICSFVRILGSYHTGGQLTGHARLDFMPAAGLVTGSEASSGAAAIELAAKLRVGIIGFGRFGQFLAKTFKRYADVYATSRGDYKTIASNLGVGYFTTAEEMLSHKLDVVLLSCSILSFEDVVKGLPMHLMRGLLIVDVLSVKVHAKVVMKKLLPVDCDILCTHPMFGPDSGRYGWGSLPFVFDKVRVTQESRCDLFLHMFEAEGCAMVELSCDAHDAYAAGSQFITHFTGRLLGELHLKSTPINTRGFETLLELVRNTCRDSFDLFYALFTYNPNSREQLNNLNDAFSTVVRQLDTYLKPLDDKALKINPLIEAIPPSSTVYLAAKVLELQRAGVTVHSLAVGEPDLRPAPQVTDAVVKAMADGHMKYTNVSGIPELRMAICKYLKDFKGVSYVPEQVLCTNGAKQSVFQSLLCLVCPRDEVLIPTPYWVSYPDIVTMVGGTPKFLQTYAADGYCISPEAVAAAITPRTRVLILCNPSNPTGVVQRKETLEAIARVLNRPENRHVIVVSDEIYERIVFDEPHVCFAALEGMYERTVVINGFSKGFSMTGFRLGYMAGPLSIINPCRKILSQMTHAPNSMAQHAGIAALSLPESVVVDMVKIYRDKRDFMMKRFAGIAGLIVPKPEGAFYILPCVSEYFGRHTTVDNVVIKDSNDFCIHLLSRHGAAVMPGDAFGAPGTIRLSYAENMVTLTAVMDAIEAFCKELK